MSAPDTPIKRAIVSFDNMSAELADAFREKYPRGYSDYFINIKKIEKPNGDYFYAVPVEIPGVNYLVKIKVKEDHIEDIEDGLFKNDEGDEQDDAPTGDGDFPVSDDDIDAAGSGEECDGDEGGDD